MTTHKLSGSRLYTIWHGADQRCNNPNNRVYESYGGRGIRMCEEWLKDFKSFYDWAIPNGYEVSLTLDRENNDGDYEPGNCRWVTRKVQSNNTRMTTFIEIDGIVKSISEWSEISGIPKGSLRGRIKRGIVGKELFHENMRGRVKTDSWREKQKGKPITINGVCYPSYVIASQSLGLTYAAFKGRLKRGTL